jgi:hypothetical protein
MEESHGNIAAPKVALRSPIDDGSCNDPYITKTTSQSQYCIYLAIRGKNRLGVLVVSAPQHSGHDIILAVPREGEITLAFVKVALPQSISDVQPRLIQVCS